MNARGGFWAAVCLLAAVLSACRTWNPVTGSADPASVIGDDVAPGWNHEPLEEHVADCKRQCEAHGRKCEVAATQRLHCVDAPAPAVATAQKDPGY